MTPYEKLETQLKKERHTWLVTGAAGFIGSHLAERLIQLNQKVIGLDNFVTGQRSNIELLKKQSEQDFHFVEGSFEDAEVCKAALKDCDYVLHQGAIGSVPRSVERPMDSYGANVNGFVTLLDLARQKQIKKFVYASSSSVYGDHPKLPKQEDEIGYPLSPYAATKRVDEIFAQTYERTYGLETTGLRYFNVFGARQDPKGPYAAVIPLWIDSMKSGQPIYINGDGSYSRDFCYIENVVQANLLAAFTKTPIEQNLFNIAYGDRTTLLQLFSYLKELVQKYAPGVKVPEAEHRDFRKGDIPHSLANVNRAKEILGYVPVVDVKAGLDKTVQYFLHEARD